MIDERTRQIRVGQAIGLAYQFALFSVGAQDPDAVVVAATAAFPSVLAFINATQAAQEPAVPASGQAQTGASGVEGVQAAFPGSTVLPAAPSEPFPMERSTVQPQGGFSPGPAPQPAPIPNQSRGGGSNWKQEKAEDAFRSFMQDTTQWEDVRGNKRSADSPDFRHKWQNDPPNRDGKVYKTSLWLRDAPEWAKPQLQQWGLI